MQNVDVVGAGMSGLLAAAILRKNCNSLHEAAASLPNNHSAVLRFRSSIIADTLNIPFRRVQAMKAVEVWRNPIADALAYSRKTNGTATLRSVLGAYGSLEERFIAPPDLVERMAGLVEAPIVFGQEYPFWVSGARPVISTIPMPSLMKVLAYPEAEFLQFRHLSGANVLAKIEDADAYCSLYIADPSFPAGRISLTGDQMAAECCGGWRPAPDEARAFAVFCAEKLGLHSSQVGPAEVRQQRYAKILPIEEDARRRFIMWASEERGIYSLGRYATWRPGLLLDDLVNDVRVIQRLIDRRGESYQHKMRR